MRKIYATFLALVTVGLSILLGAMYTWDSVDVAGMTPQPIDFSHALHAGDLQIDCRYCHRHPGESAVAGMPSVQICVSCHRSVATETDETKKLMDAWENKRPMHWVRLQRLPDHVYFTHEMHLHAGLQCAACHGQVETTRQPPNVARYRMGWCLSCHQERGASQDCWACHQ